MICYRIFLLSSGIFNRFDAICECRKTVSVQSLEFKEMNAYQTRKNINNNERQWSHLTVF